MGFLREKVTPGYIKREVQRGILLLFQQIINIFDIIQTIRETGTTVLLVEQNAKKALSIADRAYVLETGKISLSGKASDLINDASVKKAYLGE